MKTIVLNGRITRGDVYNVMVSMAVGDCLWVINAQTVRNARNLTHGWAGEGSFTATACLGFWDLNYLSVERTA